MRKLFSIERVRRRLDVDRRRLQARDHVRVVASSLTPPDGAQRMKMSAAGENQKLSGECRRRLKLAAAMVMGRPMMDASLPKAPRHKRRAHDYRSAVPRRADRCPKTHDPLLAPTPSVEEIAETLVTLIHSALRDRQRLIVESLMRGDGGEGCVVIAEERVFEHIHRVHRRSCVYVHQLTGIRICSERTSTACTRLEHRRVSADAKRQGKARNECECGVFISPRVAYFKS